MDRTPEEEAEVKAMQDEILKPPPSSWSDEPPKEPGWYWYRENEDTTCVFFEQADCVELRGGAYVESRLMTGQWQPVAPPLA